MRHFAIPTLLSLLSIGCAGSTATVDGTVAGQSFGDINTVMYGGPFVIIADVDLECIDVAWITRHYEQGEAVTDFDFQLLQFAFSDPNVTEGVFNLAGEASVTGKFIYQKSGALAEFRGREGTLQVEALEQDKAAIGLFDLGFDEGSFTGDFDAEWCRNLKDN
ncbi:MAG: hypothetical protein ABIO70_33475 [Pseudomonadota bacterium]